MVDESIKGVVPGLELFTAPIAQTPLSGTCVQFVLLLLCMLVSVVIATVGKN